MSNLSRFWDEQDLQQGRDLRLRLEALVREVDKCGGVVRTNWILARLHDVLEGK